MLAKLTPGHWNDTCGVRSSIDSKCSISGSGPPDATGRACIGCVMKECCDTLKACIATAPTTC